MRQLTVFAFVALVFSQVSVWAQDVAKADIFGGYSFINAEGASSTGDRGTLHGWEANVTGNMNSRFGIVGDVAGYYKTISGEKIKAYSFAGGPKFSYRSDGATIFGQALFGGLHTSFGSLGSENDFAMAYGGGVDVKAGESISVRVAQFDWLLHKSGGEWAKKDIRMSFGIVFHSN